MREFSGVQTSVITWRAKCLPLCVGFYLFVCFWYDSHQWARVSSVTRFLDHTQWRTTVGRTPLDEWSAGRRDLPDNTQHSKHRDIHDPDWIRNHNFSWRAAVELRLRPRSHWERQVGHWYPQTRGEESPYKQIILVGQADIVKYCNTFCPHCF